MLKDLRYELTRGWAYRSIRHPGMPVFTIWLPLCLTALIGSVYLLLPIKPALLGKDGAVGDMLSIVATLPGFYFAGLAAVATFGGADMDREMPAPAPTIDILVAGRYAATKLTRRQFLSYLFSYLVILSFILCFGLLFLKVASPSINLVQSGLIRAVHGYWLWLGVKAIGGVSLVAVFSSMVITTLHGVFFLTEKIHQP